MAEEAIVIQIDLETNVSETFAKIEKASGETGIAVSRNISQKLQKTIVKATKETEKNVKSLGQSISETFQNTRDILEFGATIGSIGIAAFNLKDRIKDVFSLTKQLAEIKFKPTGIFGLTSLLGDISIGLGLLSATLSDSESKFLKFISRVSLLGSIITGGLAAAFTIAITKISEFGVVVGTQLVKFFQDAANAANEFESSTEIFSATVDAVNRTVKENIGLSEDWIKTINKTADAFNLSRKEVTKSAQEILLVGTKLGLTQDQLEKLIKVSSEYAKINKKDVFQTTVNLVNALNGNAQAVQAYGIKLNAAAVQQQALSEGITKSVTKLGESEKVQLRYNKLLKQYKEVAGLGAIAANTLADQQKRLELNQKRLSVELGKGARIIEQNNIAAFALNLVLDNVSDSVLKVTGFFGALGSRVLQIGSFLLGLSFKFFLVVKALKAINAILKSKLFFDLAKKEIPFLNTSLNKLISNLAGVEIQLKSVKDIASFLALTVKNQLNRALVLVSGQSLTTATAVNVLKGAFLKLTIAVRAATAALLPFVLPFLKIAAIVTAIVAPFVLLFKAFQQLEKQTGALSQIYSILIDNFTQSTGVIASIGRFFGDVTTKIKELATKGFGLLVDKLGKFVKFAIDLAKKNPFKVFSKTTLARLAIVSKSIDGFRKRLADAKFDLNSFAKTKREPANITPKVDLVQLAQSLEQVKGQLENAGLNQKQIILKNAQEQRDIINQALQNRLLDQSQADALLLKVKADTAKKLKDIESKSARSTDQFSKSIADSLENGAVRTISSAFQSLGKTLVDSGDDFKGFLGTVLNILGDLAISIGTTVIASSKAIAALKASLFAGPAAPIALGGALIAIGAALKVFGSKFGGSSTGSIPTSASGGGVAAGGDVGVPDTAIADAPTDREARPEQTQVQLIVQGDILDSQETGTRIAKILSDAFEKDGIVLNNGAVS